MPKQQLQAAATVLVAAVAGFVYYDLVLDVTVRGVLRWSAVVEGVLVAAAVLTAWTVARSRSAAAVGVAFAVALGLLGAFAFDPASIVFRTPIGWAVLLTLGLRTAVPATRAATNDVRQDVAR